jgi:hypothetical protein
MPLLRLSRPRLPTRRVYRAFRELDTYSDEQCRRFVQAAKGSIRRRLFALAVIVLVTLIGTSAGIVGFWYVQNTWFDPHRSLNIGHPLVTWYGWLLNIALGITACAVGPILGYLTRDFFLIRRIRHILRTRGTCISCRYTLVGLFVAPDLNVTCPECGTTTTVDPALGELVTDEAGRPRFKPDDSRHKARRFFTDARVKRLKRAAPWIATAIIGGPLALVGAYEIFLRWQAGVAQRERPGPNALPTLVASWQPADSRPSDPNAWTLFEQAARIKSELDFALWNGPDAKWFEPDSSGSATLYPDYSFIYHPTDFSPAPDEDASDRAMREHEQKRATIAHEMMEGLEQTRIFDLLAQMADAARDDRTFDWDPNAPVQLNSSRILGDARSLAQICAARMHVMRAADDRLTYLQSAIAGLALASVHMRQPVLMDYLVGVAIQAVILQELRLDIEDGLPDAWLNELEQILTAHARSATHDRWIEGERIAGLETIAWAFGDPSNVRLGRWSMAITRNGFDRGRLGTYRKNTRILNQNFDAFAHWQGRPIKDRPPFDPSDNKPGIVFASQYRYSNLVTIDGQSRLYLAATRATLALERHRAAHGDYPHTLEELVPIYLDATPVDPWSGEPLGYVRVDPATDPLGRHYLLYSAGSDFEDNGGRANPALKFPLQMLALPPRPDTHGYDFIVNAPN